jgi:hypothetical protein
VLLPRLGVADQEYACRPVDEQDGQRELSLVSDTSSPGGGAMTSAENLFVGGPVLSYESKTVQMYVFSASPDRYPILGRTGRNVIRPCDEKTSPTQTTHGGPR